MSNEDRIIEAELLPARSATNNKTGSSSVAGSPNWLIDLAENRLMVLGILFLVTGVLGLPLLWISSKFTPIQKFALSIIVTIYTVILIAVVVWITMWSWERVTDSLS